MDNIVRELTVSEASQIAKRHRRTILNWIKQGYLPATRLPGKKGHYRVKLADLTAVLTSEYHPEG